MFTDTHVVHAYYAIVLLPITLIYFLAIARFLEKRLSARREKKFFIYDLISVRDAALVTFTLDISEIVKLVDGIGANFSIAGTKFELAFIGVLLVLHFSILVVSRTISTRPVPHFIEDQSSSYRGLISVYLATLLILTNAISLRQLVGIL
jgi:hypothetical protein